MSLGNILSSLAPVAAGFAFPGYALAAGAATGAGIAALRDEDPLMGAVTGGLGGYGGGGIREAANTTAMGLTGTQATTGEAAKAAFSDPKAFLGNLGDGSMGKGAAKLGSVGLPAIAGAMVPDYNANPDDNPMSKYDPNRRLNLGMTTGIQNALTRDSGLRLNQPFTQFNEGGYLETGMGDGMSDDIPSSIDGAQPAALSENEFVIPADVVSHIGNGSSDAGAKKLYAMMDKIRQARTGKEKQAPEINAERMMPV